MRQSIKAVLGFLIIVAVVGCLIAFISDFDRTPWRWILPLLFGSVGFLSAAILLKMHFKRDLAPDFLFEHSGKYFDCNGCCFNFAVGTENGTCTLLVMFQNRYEKPCQAQLGFRVATCNMPNFNLDIECAPAAFGIARFPLAVPVKFQGTIQRFEFGATVRYTSGRGRMLRFRDGFNVRDNAQLGNNFGTALTIAGAFVGHILLSNSAAISLQLPMNVAETLPNTSPPGVVTLWQLGQPLKYTGFPSPSAALSPENLHLR